MIKPPNLQNLFLGLLFITSMAVVTEATAYEFHVQCNTSDCLSEGWTLSDTMGRWLTKVDCTDGDCIHKGWTSWNSNGTKSISTCKKEDCWQFGWYEETPFERWIADVTCRIPANPPHANELKDENDENEIPRCLSKGWETFYPGGIIERTSCLNGDCVGEGWEIFRNGRLVTRVICHEQGCFNKGWTIYQ
jgi:hypothetical protein